jgi:demethylmenaquinone methyltransferase/2-methoxy-6-polyprenyl-1,4-benzoquinol methylase
MLGDGGLLLMHDFIYPPTPALRFFWRAYFGVMQAVGSRIFPAWREIFFGLPQLIERTRWVSELEAALRAYRFRDVRIEPLTLHGSAIVSARK